MKILNQIQAKTVAGGETLSSYDFETALYGWCGAWLGSIGAVVAIHSLPAPYDNPLVKIAGFFAGGTVGRTVGHVFGAGLYHINQQIISGVDSYLRPVEIVENTTI